MTLTTPVCGITMPHSENRRQSEPDSKAHERNRKRLCRRCKRSQRADEKGVGYTESHALKTALHKAVDRN